MWYEPSLWPLVRWRWLLVLFLYLPSLALSVGALVRLLCVGAGAGLGVVRLRSPLASGMVLCSVLDPNVPLLLVGTSSDGFWRERA